MTIKKCVGDVDGKWTETGEKVEKDIKAEQDFD